MIRTLVLLTLTLAASSNYLFSQVVYVVNSGSNSMSAYTINPSSGALTAVPGSPFPAGMLPGSVAVDPSGKFVYVTSSGGLSAVTVNPSNGALSAVQRFTVQTGFVARGMAVHPTGKFVYVAGLGIWAYTADLSSGALTAVPGSPIPLENYAREMVVDPTGKFLYAVTNYGLSAYTINAGSGVLTAVPGSPFGTQFPIAAAIDPSGRFLYAAGLSDTISAYTINASSGALTPVPGATLPAGTVLVALVVDPTGKFVYTATSDDTVWAYRINAASGSLMAVPGSPFPTGAHSQELVGGPSGVAVDPTGKFVYATNRDGVNSQISPNNISALAINTTSGALTPVPGSPFPIEAAPWGIAIRSQLLTPALPVIAALAPSSTTAGSPAFMLTVTGTSFASGATVLWNGATLATTFVSATQLTAAVPASLIATAGSGSVTVSNAVGMVSNAVKFTINPVSVSISAGGVVNGASHAGGAVSAGEIVTISGSNFGPGVFTGYQLDGNGFVTTSLGGLQALFDGVAAPLLSAQAGQVTAVVPYEVSGNPSTELQISYQGQTSSAVTVPVAVAAPGIFTADSSGSGQGMIFNEDGTANAPGNAASGGSTVIVYATGEGQTIPSGVDGKPGDPATPPVPVQMVTATVGGLDAPVVAAGGISGMPAGYLQVSVQIPPDVTMGDAVSIVLNVGGISSQANVTLAVQ
jgi:6-phosphogluconolactonase